MCAQFELAIRDLYKEEPETFNASRPLAPSTLKGWVKKFKANPLCFDTDPKAPAAGAARGRRPALSLEAFEVVRKTIISYIEGGLAVGLP